MSELGQDEVQVWWIVPGSVPADFQRQYEELLAPDERRRIGRLVSARDRLLHLCAQAMLRAALSAFGDLAPQEWRFERSAAGKPRLVPGQTGPDFNLTHTPGLAACALAWRSELGIDAEHDRGGQAPFDLIASVFTGQERARLERLAPADRAAAFFDLWTLKEAGMKALGLGLALPPQELEVACEPPRVRRLHGSGGLWRCVRLRPTAHHHLAVVVSARPGLERLTMRSCLPLVSVGERHDVALGPAGPL